MGQQQLLLLVLATVIVGIATVVGIEAFSQNNVKSNADALMNDAVRIASDAQAWSQKSQPFGGPSTLGNVGEASFKDIGYETDAGGSYVNANGVCAPLSGSGKTLLVTCSNTDLGNKVTVTVNANLSGSDAISGVVDNLGDL
jgi:hypothetical protein